jgi:four helix bundle protein
LAFWILDFLSDADGVRDEHEFKARTKHFALKIIELTEELPRTLSAQVIGKQLLRSGTSVGANYRAACRAKSADDMKAKLGIVEEEADESLFWLELLEEAKLIDNSHCRILVQEGNEILAMTVASIKTLRSRQQRK